MKRIMIFVAAWLFVMTGIALADHVYQITRDGQAVGNSITLSDQDETSVITYAISIRKGTIEQTPAIAAQSAVLDQSGNVITPAVPAQAAVMRDPTATEAMALSARDFFLTLTNAATQWLKTQAAQSAADGVAPIVPK